jgi:hypothetical protein
MHPIGRLLVDGWSPRSTAEAARMLYNGLTALPEPVRYFVAPGGFVTKLIWPGTDYDLIDEAPEEFFKNDAQIIVEEVVADLPRGAHRSSAAYFSFGIDFRTRDGGKYAELVAVVDLATRRLVRLTGKSYPTQDEMKLLLRVANFESHLFEPGNGDVVLVLGCHDLNLFNARGAASAKDAKLPLIKEAHRVFPGATVVLHHPHYTDIANTWVAGWRGIKKALPTLEAGASGIARPCLGTRANDSLEVIAEATQLYPCTSIDVVVWGHSEPDLTLRQFEAAPIYGSEAIMWGKFDKRVKGYLKSFKKFHDGRRPSCPPRVSLPHKGKTGPGKCPRKIVGPRSAAPCPGPTTPPRYQKPGWLARLEDETVPPSRRSRQCRTKNPPGRTPGQTLPRGIRVTVYRAVRGTTERAFRPNDYVTKNLKFAIGHAKHNAAVDEEPSLVLALTVDGSLVAEAYNPGEFFYVGPPATGRVAFKARPTVS